MTKIQAITQTDKLTKIQGITKTDKMTKIQAITKTSFFYRYCPSLYFGVLYNGYISRMLKYRYGS